MLWLTRKFRTQDRVGERIIILCKGEKITIEVGTNYGRDVSIGVQAPDHAHIDREEIYIRKLEEGYYDE